MPPLVIREVKISVPHTLPMTPVLSVRLSALMAADIVKGAQERNISISHEIRRRLRYYYDAEHKKGDT